MTEDPRDKRPRRMRREDERIARLNQLAEMGKLAAGLAHELKNPLSTLKLNLQLLEEDLADLARGRRSRTHRSRWRARARSDLRGAPDERLAPSSKRSCGARSHGRRTYQILPRLDPRLLRWAA